MQPHIKIQEPFKKSWSEPQIIVTREDIMNYENTQTQTFAPQMKGIDNAQSQTQNMLTKEQIGDRPTSTEMLKDRLMELRNSLLQSQSVKQQLRTPNKHCEKSNDPCSGLISGVSTTKSKLCDRIIQQHSMSSSDVSTLNSQVCDRIIPEHTMARSLPSLPLIGEIPNMTSSPTIPSTQERHFNFVPERLRFLGETQQFLESDEVDNGFWLPQGYCYSPQGTSRCHTALHRSPMSPGTGMTIDSRYFTPKIRVTDTPPLRAKRKLDMDDPYSTSVKRAKSDISNDAGLRYVNQLEIDLIALKHRIQSASSERTTRHTNCACTEMEKHFMEMATSAYKSIRRYDGTMDSFAQFKEELTQTNKVIKDSMELLQNVRRLCVH